jgi:hypothetical protein
MIEVKMRKIIKLGLLVLVVVCFFGSLAWSQSNRSGAAKGFGIRAGYGTDPDQFVIGAQAVLGKTLGFMRFAPSFDAGFGNNMTTYLINADFRLLSFSPPGSSAGLYAGTGLALAILDPNEAESDVEIGINAVTGVTFPMGRNGLYNLEVRFGVVDMPELRILFGMMFGVK